MGFVMPKPKSLKSGALTARQVIPTDVREEYQRLYGKAWEERWRASPVRPKPSRNRVTPNGTWRFRDALKLFAQLSMVTPSI